MVRDLENLGERLLPYKMYAHNQKHSCGGALGSEPPKKLHSEAAQRAQYFMVDFHAPPTLVESIMEHLSRDTDVIRPNIVKHPLTQEVKECARIVPVPLEEKLYFVKKKKK